MQHRRAHQRTTHPGRLLGLVWLALLLGLPGPAVSTAAATRSTMPAETAPAAGRLSLGPPIYRGKLTDKKKAGKCRRGCAATCKTLSFTPSQYQLHCNAKGYTGLVIFSGKRCKKTGTKIHCWFKNKKLIFRGTKTR